MSIIDISARAETTGPDAPLIWKQAADDVFVATTHAGEFAGFVTVDPQAHVVHNRHNRRIGSYKTLGAALDALAAGEKPKPRRRPRRRTPGRAR